MTDRRVWRLTIGFASIVLLNASLALASDSIRSEIEAANKTLETTFARGDSPGMAALYTVNAQLLPAQSDVVTSRQAIAQFWQSVFDSGVKGITLIALEVESFGDTANEVGKLELLDADGKVLDRAKYVVIWKKEAGSWKLHRDIWTTSMVPVQK